MHTRDPISYWVDKFQVTATILIMEGMQKVVKFEDEEGKGMVNLKIDDWDGGLKALGYTTTPPPKKIAKSRSAPKIRKNAQNGPTSKGGSSDWKRWSFAVVV